MQMLQNIYYLLAESIDFVKDEVVATLHTVSK